MASVYYNGNDVDVSTKDALTSTLLTKIVKQEIDSKVFEDLFGIFTKKLIDGVGDQVEEFEIGNLTSSDFDPTGANALAKASMNFKALYHKINREKSFKATISNAQIKKAMLSKEGLADVANMITNELYNSSSIEDYDSMKQLFLDIAGEMKAMTICDMAGVGDKMDALIKAIQTLAENMTKPTNLYNYSGFKREFCKKEDLVLIVDSATRARLNVDSLAGAFNMEKKDLVSNIIVLDELPTITYSSLTAKKYQSINIGEAANIDIYKYLSTGTDSVSGTAIAFLVSKQAIKRDIIEREIDTQHNGAGRFTNYWLHATDLLSYSTLRNAIVFVD